VVSFANPISSGSANKKLDPNVSPYVTNAFSPSNKDEGSTHDSNSSDNTVEQSDELSFFNVVSEKGQQQLRTPTHRSSNQPTIVQQIGVPQEQYDALKSKFAAHDLSIKKHEETVQNLEREIKRRDDQINEMENIFNQRIRVQENI